ncbi:MAG TPA: hypothetical protein VIT62_09395 [Lysobacter sp.]
MKALSILVVEDSAEKRDRITAAVRAGAVGCSITYAGNVIDAKKAMSSVAFDLLILDLALPNYPDEELSPNAGANLLREVQDYDIYLKPRYVIGVTGYADLSTKYEEDFTKRFWQLIRSDLASVAWADQLTHFVAHIGLLSSQKSRHSVVDFAVMTALSDEFDAVLKLPFAWSAAMELDEHTYYRLGTVNAGGKSLSIAVFCALRMGPVPAAVLASKVVSLLRPKVFGMIGICAGVKGEANLGDVVVATEVWSWEAGKLVGNSDQKFLPEPNGVSTSEAVLAKMQQLQSDASWLDELRRQFGGKVPATNLRMLFAPVATGSPVVSDSEIVARIRGVNRKTVGIEMEAFAALFAARSWYSVPPLLFCFKSVSDHATEDKDDSVRDYAAFTSAQALGELLRRFGADLV